MSCNMLGELDVVVQMIEQGGVFPFTLFIFGVVFVALLGLHGSSVGGKVGLAEATASSWTQFLTFEDDAAEGLFAI